MTAASSPFGPRTTGGPRWGEQTPAWLALILLATGAFAAAGSARLVLTAAETSTTGPPTSGATITAPSTVVPLATSPFAPGPSTPGPSTPGPSSAPPDCPPLFLVSFPDASVEPVETDIDRRVADLAAWLIAHSDAQLVLDGHADTTGDEAANLAISAERARAVAARLTAVGVPADRLQTRGFGDYLPIVGVESGSARNRRVTMRVLGLDACPTSDGAPVHDSAVHDSEGVGTP